MGLFKSTFHKHMPATSIWLLIIMQILVQGTFLCLTHVSCFFFFIWMIAVLILEGIISGYLLDLMFHNYVVTSMIFSDQFLSTKFFFFLCSMLLVGISFEESNRFTVLGGQSCRVYVVGTNIIKIEYQDRAFTCM